MQKLAGILKESQLNEADFNKWAYNNNHGVEIVFKSFPANPNDVLMDEEEEEEITKASFWKNDLKGYNRIPQGLYADGVTESGPVYANELPNGTWKLTWDVGEISGFVEGEDFNFIPEEEL
jgi:hypothetical protein